MGSSKNCAMQRISHEHGKTGCIWICYEAAQLAWYAFMEPPHSKSDQIKVSLTWCVVWSVRARSMEGYYVQTVHHDERRQTGSISSFTGATQLVWYVFFGSGFACGQIKAEVADTVPL